MKQSFEYILKVLSKKILKKYKPKVVGITGSVGKTGTKEMVAVVLNKFLRVRAPKKNFNNEIGVPLTIIGAEGPGRSPVRWLKVMGQAIGLLLKRDESYPEVLVLEMGADKPGDIHYLTQIAPCDVGVVTAVGPSHLQAFGNVANVLKEKKIIVSHLPKEGVAVLNKDDQLVWPLENEISAHILSYGFASDAMIRGENFLVRWSPSVQGSEYSQGPSTSFANAHSARDDNACGVEFDVVFDEKRDKVFLKNILGKQQVYSALAAVAVGLALGLEFEQVTRALEWVRPNNGRMRLLPGIKKSWLIDDSYNSSPVAALMAVDTLGSLASAGEKFAVLGDMLELGPVAEQAHQELGIRVVKNNIDYLVTVGELGKEIAHAAREAGMKEEFVYSFPDPVSAGKFIQDRIEEGDLLLIKGSQGVRMEKIVKEIMAEPEKASELLVRQDETWV